MVSFTVNGKIRKVYPNQLDSGLTLAQYLRQELNLTGTKQPCGEGGCGACTVALTQYDEIEKKWITSNVNSCLRPVHGLDGTHVITIEGLGDKKQGLHELQKRLGEVHGSQCGYCTPGFIMAAYGQLGLENKPDERTVKASLDSNICRCTGYRPIAEFSHGIAKAKASGQLDIEDLGKKFAANSIPSYDSKSVAQITCRDGTVWAYPRTRSQMHSVIKTHEGCKKLTILAGTTLATESRSNAASQDEAGVLINVRHVAEMHAVTVRPDDRNIVIGGAITLEKLVKLCGEHAKSPDYAYLKGVAEHILKVATSSIRHVGTWAGNLGWTRKHPDFPSDLAIIFEACGATVLVCADGANSEAKDVEMTPLEYVTSSKSASLTSRHVVTALLFRPKLKNFRFWSYKDMPRATGALAVASVACGVMLTDDARGIIGTPQIVVTSFGPNVHHCYSTEKLLADKALSKQLFTGALAALLTDLKPAAVDAFEAKSRIVRNLFYRFWLTVLTPPAALTGSLASASTPLERKMCVGVQKFEVKDQGGTVGKPLKKVEMDIQCTGQIQYTDDEPSVAGQLYMSIIRSDRALVEIKRVDASAALACEGVEAVYDYHNIPGMNSLLGVPLLAETFTEWAGEPVALLLADSRQRALAAAKKVVIEYGERVMPPKLGGKDSPPDNTPTGTKPADRALILDPRSAVKAEYYDIKQCCVEKRGDVEKAFSGAKHIIEGEVLQNDQWHFYLEQSACFATPVDGGRFLKVIASTQAIMLVEMGIMMCTGRPLAGMEVVTNRIGGAFGGKCLVNDIVNILCAMAAHISNRPVRSALTVHDSLVGQGKRTPVFATYKVACDDMGILKGVKIEAAFDFGARAPFGSELCDHFAMTADGGYQCDNWDITVGTVRTDKPPNTFMRAPGQLPPTFVIETIMEKIAVKLGLEGQIVRERNLVTAGYKTMKGQPVTDGDIMARIWQRVKDTAQWEARAAAVSAFNKENKFRKRGICIVPTRYCIDYGMKYTILMSLHGDGSINLSHGTIEMGQGTNTKLAQLAARAMQCPLEMIHIVGSSSITNINSFPSGGSTSMEIAAMAVLEACKELNKQLEPLRAEAAAAGSGEGEAAWPAIVGLMQLPKYIGCDFSARAQSAAFSHATPTPIVYNVYSGVVCEIELDTLTGDVVNRRTDIVMDCGDSINPGIDIGQVEGSFVQGAGYWTMEKLGYDHQTGRVLTDSTFTYHAPMALDAPEDFRVELYSDSQNKAGVLSSKGIGEPPILGSVAAAMAIKGAVNSARAELGLPPLVDSEPPFTMEDVVVMAGILDNDLIGAIPDTAEVAPQLVHVYSK